MKSVSMDDLRLDRMNDSRSSYEFLHRPRIHASENQYESGFPDTKYVQGREHRVMKDSRGDETYIYQPSSCIYPVSRTRDGSAYSSYVAGPSVYDYIDTESKFEIQRPNIRLGNMNKY
ncbi:uncharacterized protein LOC128550449 [Mercenaria mercenaria]|uniref:uncharacterized protein LOC128550449 n=1 Tax=Mercenaria mercenaria TaxID=6596 RepID=UPI00234EB54B|nr:uncharacterized protein LOC128550449 [Mercenaria mercenaria]